MGCLTKALLISLVVMGLGVLVTRHFRGEGSFMPLVWFAAGWFLAVVGDWIEHLCPKFRTVRVSALSEKPWPISD